MDDPSFLQKMGVSNSVILILLLPNFELFLQTQFCFHSFLCVFACFDFECRCCELPILSQDFDSFCLIL